MMHTSYDTCLIVSGNYSWRCRSCRPELLGCQVSTIPHERRYINSYTSNKNIYFEMILDVGIGEKRKETRFLI